MGVSYAPENGSGRRGAGGPDGNADPVQTEEDNGDFQNILEIGMNFVRSINGINAAWSSTGVYAQLEECGYITNALDNTGYQGCLNVEDNVDRFIVHHDFQLSFSRRTIGAGASVDNWRFKVGQGISWEGSAGVTHAFGPWTVGVQGGYGEANRNYYKMAEPFNFGIFAGVDTKAAASLGASYTLGPAFSCKPKPSILTGKIGKAWIQIPKSHLGFRKLSIRTNALMVIP